MNLTNGNAQYDDRAKRILAQKKILAYILKRTISEFYAVSLADIANKYIEGEPLISAVPVNKDETNLVLQKLREQETDEVEGLHNEDNSTTEGKVIFDLLFRARVPVTGEQIALIINIEAQKNIHPSFKKDGVSIEYPLLKRAVYYVSRLISSQKGTVFTGSDYDKIQKVYSIWICMDGPEGQTAINRYQLKEQHLLHRYKEPEKNYDLAGIVFVYLGNQRVRDKMMNMLHLVFKEPLSSEKKEKILKEKYDIDLNAAGKEALDTMCNLSEGIYEKGFNNGISKGIKQGISQGISQGITRGKIEDALEMLKDGLPFETVAKYTKLSLKIIENIAKQNKLI